MDHATSTNCIFPIANFTLVKDMVLNWTNRFSTFCFLDNHQYNLAHHSAECIVAAGVVDSLEIRPGDGLVPLEKFIGAGNRWLFGHLSYDLKNELETLPSSGIDHIGFPPGFFFQPEVIIRLDKNRIEIASETGREEKIFQEILATEPAQPGGIDPIKIQDRLSKDEYLSIIRKLKEHILRGDCYEINFCQEFFAEQAHVDPLRLYKNLSLLSPNPFSAFYKTQGRYLLCASPERFLKKQGQRILSQPIKGTSRRMIDQIDDDKSKTALFESSKDRAENVMIVDLMRNDLSKICKEGSVVTDELYGVYSFPQVHQMISTISGELRDPISFSEIIAATFPMGSMTGAPKRRVMQLIEQYEKTKRGIFSGAVGYIEPSGDFDFNVVIRSIMYNAVSEYLSFLAGSGITFYSDPEKEWEECIVKVMAMRKVIEGG